MPRWDKIQGIALFEDDICDGCSRFMNDCNVWPELSLDQDKSKWNNIHIVHEGTAEGRKNYIGCKSFREYTAPKDKAGINPRFGHDMTKAEFDSWNGN
jgi:predicted Fe-S protein YdhL (DUF1289 family)